MKRVLRCFFFLPTWLFAAGALAQGKFVYVGYSNCLAVASYTREQLEQVARLKWYFTHASVGVNLMEGLADLHQLAPATYQLQPVTANQTPPAETRAGAIYEHNRGNPGWKAKFDGFDSCVSNGWRFPTVNIAINKLCYIDQTASLRYYLNSMTNLEAAYPQTVFVYVTMPLTTAQDSENHLRNLFNNRLRDWCRANGRVLFDLADIEAHNPEGAACSFTYSGKVCQRLCDGYTTDGGHLNPSGRQLVARGFYALGAAVLDRGRLGNIDSGKP